MLFTCPWVDTSADTMGKAVQEDISAGNKELGIVRVGMEEANRAPGTEMNMAQVTLVVDKA